MTFLSIAAGLVLLFVGGEVLVRGAVAIATRFNISPVLVGLTIVAFGTSAPELTVALAAALEGQPGITIGGVVGSNISNILLVLSVTALVQPLKPETRLVMRDGLFMVAVTFALAMLALTGAITPLQGAAMLALFAVYLAVGYWLEVRGRSPAAAMHEAETEEYASVPPNLGIALPLFIAGVAGVVLGAQLLVSGAVAFASALGVSETIIGLSLVAVGTSLPELAISVIAAYRGRGDIAVGNILGSNIANILGILGITALFGTIPIEQSVAFYDAWIMVLAAVVLLPVLLTDSKLSRSEAVVLLVLYAGYVASLFFGVPMIAVALIS